MPALDNGVFIRDGVREDLLNAELVTLKRYNKTGVDTYGYGTYDDEEAATSNIRMFIIDQRKADMRVEEGKIPEVIFQGQVRDDTDIAIDDLVVRSDGTQMTVVDYWEHRPFNVLVCKFVRLRSWPVKKGNS